MDLLIIYFACGAPFGVYQITSIRRPLTARAVVRTSLRICLWPVFAVLALNEWFSNNQYSAASGLDRRIDSIRVEIESLVLDNDSIASIFDFREILHRYAGLSEAANVNVVQNSASELFELTNTTNEEIASACLARRNQRKLSFQQSLVRNEFVDMISEFAVADRYRRKIIELAIELADSLDDSKTADALTAMMSETRFEANTPGRMLGPEISVIESS